MTDIRLDISNVLPFVSLNSSNLVLQLIATLISCIAPLRSCLSPHIPLRYLFFILLFSISPSLCKSTNTSVMSSQPQEIIPSTPKRKEWSEQRKDEILTVPVPVVESFPAGSSFFHNIDGGARGWSAVLGAWLFQFSMVGAITAFGSYQTFYEDQWLNVSSHSLLLDRAYTPSDQSIRLQTYSQSSISWIGSLQLFLEFL